jgi:hypothetical protein
MTEQPKYIINDTMLLQWRTGCIRAMIPYNGDGDVCPGCQFDNKKRGGCDFDDDAMQKIFQSRPVSTLPGGAAPEPHFRIVETIPDENSLVIIGIKEDSNGAFVSRNAALDHIAWQHQHDAEIAQAARNEKVPPKPCFGEYKECPCDDECSVSWFCERFSVLFDYSNKISDDKVQAEREKVLNNLYRWVENANKKRFSLSELMMKIESLRHNKEQP